MEIFAAVFAAAFDLLRMEFNLFGFIFSFWEVLVFEVVAGLLIWILYYVFLG